MQRSVIPDDKISCPFVFPMQYAKAMSQNNIGIPVSDAAFKRDIRIIQTTLSKPIVILLDECDVLGKSRVHIEKLRNIFMNAQGFMLALTGTEALFPLINDVFSPIIRQFKKINVKPFNKIRETRDCICKPLYNLGIGPLEILDTETLYEVSAIHDLSGGRPYEIQLICHLLFRRIQQGRSKTMELTLDVLDDVLHELQSSQDTSVRPIVTKLRRLDETQLLALAALCACSGRADFEQVWFGEYFLHGMELWTKEQLHEHLRFFEDSGIVSLQGGKISFTGDDFDRIYCKYYSRKHGVASSINEISFELYLSLCLNDFLVDSLQFAEEGPIIDFGWSGESDVRVMIEAMKAGDSNSNPFDTNWLLAHFLYKANLDFIDCSTYQILIVTLATPWGKSRRWYALQTSDCTTSHSAEDIEKVLEQPSRRILEVGGRLDVELQVIPVLPLDSFSRKILGSQSEDLKKEIFDFHMGEMYEAYTEIHNVDDALLHGRLALKYNEKPDSETDANNLGYLLMVSNDIETAGRLFELVLARGTQPGIIALARFNLGVVRAKHEDWIGALEIFEIAEKEVARLTLEDQMCACLIIITEGEAGIEFNEVENPNLLVAIQTSSVTLKSHLERDK